MRVLLAEDEITIAVTLRDALEAAGHTVLPASDTAAAIAILESGSPRPCSPTSACPAKAGWRCCSARSSSIRRAPVVVLTATRPSTRRSRRWRLGARSYVQKPFRNEAIVRMVDGFARLRFLEAENARLRAELEPSVAFQGVVGASPAMRTVFDRVRTVAGSDATVLIQGESGTGKERIARAIHRAGPRAAAPFVAISCGALPETLLEAELFGHERGAFTDAHKERKGRFELADGGTLFLDDIDDMPLTVQVKVLRVLQERSFERVGGEATRRVDIRVVAATKVSLRDRVQEAASARTSSTASTSCRSCCRRCASARATCRCSSRTSSSGTAGPRSTRSRGRRSRCSSATPGRATCASSRTRSSARSRWPATGPSSPPRT
jgi:DNA-binding NtrC family response regulator